MWLPGHLAIGLLLSLIPLALWARRSSLLLKPLIFVAFFSVLPDFLHFGDLRAFSHSIFGATLMAGAVLLLLIMIQGWNPLLATIAFLGTWSHLLADLFIGHIYPWYPWSWEIVQYNQFNTLFDIRVELALSLLVFVPFAAWLIKSPKHLAVVGHKQKDLVVIVSLLGVFLIFASAQTLYYFYQNMFQNPTISEILLSFVFIGTVACSLMFLLLSISAYKNGLKSPYRTRFFNPFHYRQR